MRCVLLTSCGLLLSACQMSVPDFLAPPSGEVVAPVNEEAVAAADGAEVLHETAQVEAGELKGGELSDEMGEPSTDAAPADDATADMAASDETDVAETPEIRAATTEVQKAGFGGIFSFLKPKRVEGATDEVAMRVETEAGAALAEAESSEVRPETYGVQSTLPEVPEETAPEVQTAKPAAKTRKPLFGFLKAAPENGPVSTVKTGEVLPFGEVGINCEIRPRAMGAKVDQFPREGRPVWQLYDSAPENTAPHSQYITGFADGCARQVTAALVMFGAAGLHEVLRYSDDTDRDWSNADKTYEKIKRKTCGVGRGSYCPAERLSDLERQVAFVSIYPRFGAEEDWLELLLHDGQVMSEEMR
ncbi:hypothetical protein [Celeribacter halophilus]|uniref:hypothetical protein n=1 Tax=Celeribacter halophilus TaxID=576117 RepID=UPI003A94FE28